LYPDAVEQYEILAPLLLVSFKRESLSPGKKGKKKIVIRTPIELDGMHHLLVGVHHLIVLVVLVVQGTPLIQMTEQ